MIISSSKKKWKKNKEDTEESKINTNQSQMKRKTQVHTVTVNEMNFPIERQTCSNWAIQNKTQKNKEQKFKVYVV